MSKSKKQNPEKTINIKDLKPEQQLKYEIAQELGLYDKVIEEGWKSLSAKETGRIGGLMTKRKREIKEADLEGLEDTMKYDDSPEL